MKPSRLILLIWCLPLTIHAVLDGSGSSSAVIPFHYLHQSGDSNYKAYDSITGIAMAQEGKTDFAVTEYVPDDMICAPLAATGLLFIYSFDIPPGLAVTIEIVLGIYNGTIRHWRHPAILAENTNLQLPNATITPIYRTSNSGVTYFLTSVFSAINSQWKSQFGASYSPDPFRTLLYDANYSTSNIADMQFIVSKTPYSFGYMSGGTPFYRKTYISFMKNSEGKIVKDIPGGSKISTLLLSESINETTLYSAEQLQMLTVNNSLAYPLIFLSYWCFIQNASIENRHPLYEIVIKGYDVLSSIEYHTGYFVPSKKLQVASKQFLRCKLFNECGQVDYSSFALPSWALLTIISGLSGIILIIISLIWIATCLWRRKEKSDLRLSLLEADSLMHTSLNMDGLVLNECIGKGSFGEVYKAKLHGTRVAVKKCIASQNHAKQQIEDFTQEVALLSQLRHPNIIQYIGSEIRAPFLILITEYCKKGDLQAILRDHSIHLEMKQQLGFALDIARGMHYLHKLSPPVLHRDLKCGNCLVDKNWNVKVADFGLSRTLATETTMTMCGNAVTAAPEVLARTKYSEKADVYSFGIVLWEVFTRRVAYENMNVFEIARRVVIEDLRPELNLEILADSNRTPPFIVKLMERCWSSNPEQRPSFAEICHHLEHILKDSYSESVPYMEESQEYGRKSVYYMTGLSQNDKELIDVNQSFLDNII